MPLKVVGAEDGQLSSPLVVQVTRKVTRKFQEGNGLGYQELIVVIRKTMIERNREGIRTSDCG